jgi:hypothetical protein
VLGAGSDWVAHLDVEVFVNLNRLAKHEDVLHDGGKLPHIPYPLEQGGLFFLWRWFKGLHLRETALSRHGGKGSATGGEHAFGTR